MSEIPACQPVPCGLHITVLRNARGDCTAGGISSRHTRLTLVGVSTYGQPSFGRMLSYASQVFAPTCDAPAVLLVRHRLGDRTLQHVEPLSPNPGIWFTAGGNAAQLVDGRLSRLIDFYGAVAIHDRDEARELHRVYSSHHHPRPRTWSGTGSWCAWSGTYLGPSALQRCVTADCPLSCPGGHPCRAVSLAEYYRDHEERGSR